MVTQRDGLRALQVGVARQQCVGVLPRAAAQRDPRAIDGAGQLHRRGARVELEVGGHLVVAAARGVQAAARLADQLGESALDVHVDVFQRRVQAPLAALELAGDCFQSVNDGLRVGRCDESYCRQHARVRLAGAGVVPVQPAVV